VTGSRFGLRIVAVVLTATALPVASLWWASVVAKAEVEQRALAGLAATGKATVLQEQQAWEGAVQIVTSAASRPVPLDALESRDTQLATLGVENILATGPFAAVRIFDGAGNLVAAAALAGVIPTTVTGTDAATATFGASITNGARTSRQIAVSIGNGADGLTVGRLVVDVDVTQLLGKSSDLAFGRTGAKMLVTRAGMVVAGSTGVGIPLVTPVNRALAAAGEPSTLVVYSNRYRRMTAESYEPIPGQDLGLLVQQARSEVMGRADHLAALLRWVAAVVGVLGSALAASLGVLLSRRRRRLATSERRLEDSHVESRWRLEQFLDAVPIGIFVTTPDGHPHYVNREAERLLGRGVVPGAGPEDLAEVYSAYLAGTTDTYPAAAMPLVRALSGETSHVDDMEIRRPDGTVPVEVWGSPVLAGDNSVEFAITAFADVSERRRAEEEVQLLSAITANMAEGVALIRADDGTIAYANGSFEAMYGYEPDELIGRPVEVINAPGLASPEEAAAAIIQSLRTYGAWEGEVHNIRKDGTILWCAVTVTALDHPKFGPTWISVHTDITARRQAQEAQATLASIVQASGEAILSRTLKGVVTSWNPGAEALFGYAAAEMIGGSIEVLIPPEGREEEAMLRARAVSGLGVEQWETVRLRKDGTLVDVSGTVSPIQDADGAITGVAVVCRDVSERKRAQAALVEREEQLAQARDQALEASALKSQFLANTSHEIRTPMTIILGMNEMLLDTELDPAQHKLADGVGRAAGRLLGVINDILDFSKIEAGHLDLEITDVELRPLVEEVSTLLAGTAEAKGLRLVCSWAPGLPERALGDAGRLRQILLNLASNAVKFTDEGQVEVRASRRTAGAAEVLRFEVVDSGIGIDSEDQRLLFQPFSQVDASSTRRHGGTGLGLAISAQLAEAMGGRIGLDSTPGSGSTFWFEIPFEEVPPLALASSRLRTAS
jgi:PAS domain S-box-containing protein